MAKLGITTGTIPDDGTGDSLLAGAIKINSNFNEIYNYFGDGSDLNIQSRIWGSTSAGVNTTSNTGIGTTNPRFALEVGSVGSSGTSLYVNGDARVSNTLSVGSSSIVLDGLLDTLTVGSGVTIYGSSGIVSAVSVYVNGSPINAINSPYSSVAGVATYATVAGVSTYSLISGIATYANISGVSTYSEVSGIATYAVTSGVSSYSPLSGISSYSTLAGIASYSTNSGLSTSSVYAEVSGIATYASTAGISTESQGLTGTPDITVGVVTAIRFVGIGSNLTGVITSIQAGSGIAINQSAGIVTISIPPSSTAPLGYWESSDVGIHTLSNVGIGTTNPTTELSVLGNVDVVGVVSATNFIGDGSGLTGVTAVGSGIEVRDNDSIIGAAATVNFGDNISVSPVSSGIVTVSLDVTNFSQWIKTSAGIHTFSSVGIGTTNPTSALAVQGDVLVSGVVTAASFVGDGSGLTGVVGSGSGIIIEDDGSVVGTAGTIDFGSGLSVSPISSGIVTVTSSGSKWETTSAGIHTLSNVGVGTTNPTSALTVLGDVLVSGASTFNGNVHLGDNQALYFGNSNDLGLIHDGIDSKIQGNGNLIIRNVSVSGVTSIVGNTVGTIADFTQTGEVRIPGTLKIGTDGIFSVYAGVGTFISSAGIAHTIDVFSTQQYTSEYTIYVGYGTYIQSQKVLVMNDGTNAYSQEYAIMYNPGLIVSIGASVYGSSIRLEVTPESGVSGLVTYRFTRQSI